MARGQGFGKEETWHLLQLLNAMTPLGGMGWDGVKDALNEEFGNDRTVDALHRKFRKLSTAKPPTGNPNCPPEVKLAYQIKRKMIKNRGFRWRVGLFQLPALQRRR